MLEYCGGGGDELDDPQKIPPGIPIFLAGWGTFPTSVRRAGPRAGGYAGISKGKGPPDGPCDFFPLANDLLATPATRGGAQAGGGGRGGIGFYLSHPGEVFRGRRGRASEIPWAQLGNAQGMG